MHEHPDVCLSCLIDAEARVISLTFAAHEAGFRGDPSEFRAAIDALADLTCREHALAVANMARRDWMTTPRTPPGPRIEWTPARTRAMLQPRDAHGRFTREREP